MDFNLTSFYTPTDQYHIDPLSGSFVKNITQEKKPISGTDPGSYDFLSRMHEGMKANNIINSNPSILKPKMYSDLSLQSRNKEYDYDTPQRYVGSYVSDDSLEKQLRQEINRVQGQKVDGVHLTNQFYGNVDRNKYDFPYSYEDARRNLILNSQGRDRSLKATNEELMYGIGPADGSRDANAYNEFKNGHYVITKDREGFDGQVKKSKKKNRSKTKSTESFCCKKNKREGYCGSGCACEVGCQCKKCKHHEHMTGARPREGLKNYRYVEESESSSSSDSGSSSDSSSDSDSDNSSDSVSSNKASRIAYKFAGNRHRKNKSAKKHKFLLLLILILVVVLLFNNSLGISLSQMGQVKQMEQQGQPGQQGQPEQPALQV